MSVTQDTTAKEPQVERDEHDDHQHRQQGQGREVPGSRPAEEQSPVGLGEVIQGFTADTAASAGCVIGK